MWKGTAAYLVLALASATAHAQVSPDSHLAIDGLRVSPTLTVDLDLERFSVTTASTRFVVGSLGGDDRPLDFDPSKIALYRGTVRGEPGSHVFLSITDRGPVGYVELSGEKYVIGRSPDPAAPFALAPAADGQPRSMMPPGLQYCSCPAADVPHEAPAAGGGIAGLPIYYRTKVLELAVETDYEFFSLFGDLDAAAEYVVQLYAAISDIYERDVDARYVLTFVRLWDDPKDLFNEENPLSAFKDYWNENMTEVQRDLAQFTSGRRNMPFGGIAYLSQVCGEFGYSACGYILGSFPDPSKPSVWHYDIGVCAHELGHNCGALHTHSYGIDNCVDLNAPPVRGPIMSYCSQTNSGGNAMKDLRFHTIPEASMREHLSEVECLITDCNGNDQDDATDVAMGSSDDVNGNGVPDECEDCNDNGMLDDADIGIGTSDDDNGNGVPDECEPDCNGNGQPDDLDISVGFSQDLWGNGVPDECETDCNSNGTSDYNEIQADATLDIDRNAELDSCQDCDGDGVNDIVALEGSRFCWLASETPGANPREFHALTGVVSSDVSGATVNGGHDLIIDDSGDIYVTSYDDSRVVRFDRFGTYVDDFVPAGGGGLNKPTALVFGPRGNLLVASSATNSVIEYEIGSGASLGTFVTPGAGGLAVPRGLAIGPNGNLYVTSSNDRVLEYSGTDGGFVGELVGAGVLVSPRGLMFLPDGRLLVASFGSDSVESFDGETGAYLGKWNQGGAGAALALDGPWCIRIGPEGHVYVSRNLLPESHGEDEHEPQLGIVGVDHLHINATRIYAFDADTGIFLRSYVTAHDTGLFFPTGFDFMPDFGTDCNENLLPDNCDIASGASRDGNGNGIPDECEGVCPGDVTGNGIVDVEDLVAVVLGFGACPPGPCDADLNGDGEVDVQDMVAVILGWGDCN